MVELKNSEKGKRCFIIGTGSSIKEQDLTLLKDEIVMGVSGLFMHKDIEIFKPKYYVLPPVFEYHKHYSDENSYVNWLSAMEQTLDKDTIYFVYEPINYTKVDKPANRIIIYDGSTYTLAPTDAYKVTGSGGSAIGVYTFTVTLNQGYMWSDSTLGDLTITYTIRERPTGWVFGNAFPIILN